MLEHLEAEDVLPTYSLLWGVFQHAFEELLQSRGCQLLREADDLFVDLGDQLLQRGSFVRSFAKEQLVKDHSHRPNVTLC